MKFSVIIPLYNKKRHIARAIESVLSQRNDLIEIIVVDDGSTDGGAEIVQNLNNPLIHMVQQPNQGTSVARNRGIAEAKGDYIAFLDADDQWLPGQLQRLADLIERFPEARAYATAYEDVTSEGNIRKRFFHGISEAPREGYLSDYFYSAAMGAPPIWTSAFCVERELFAEIGLFKPGVRLGQDLDMWGRIALHTRIAFSSTVGARYHLNADNRAISRTLPDENPAFVETVEQLRKGNIMELSHFPNLEIYLDRLRIDCAGRSIKHEHYCAAEAILSGCTTEFRLFRQRLLRIYIRFPRVYRLIQSVKSLSHRG